MVSTLHFQPRQKNDTVKVQVQPAGWGDDFYGSKIGEVQELLNLEADIQTAKERWWNSPPGPPGPQTVPKKTG